MTDVRVLDDAIDRDKAYEALCLAGGNRVCGVLPVERQV
jgi:hypothetical protein